MKQWFQKEMEAWSVVGFLNKHALKPGEFVVYPLSAKTASVIVAYYAENELE